jgi:hypothetical protein
VSSPWVERFWENLRPLREDGGKRRDPQSQDDSTLLVEVSYQDAREPMKVRKGERP